MENLNTISSDFQDQLSDYRSPLENTSYDVRKFEKPEASFEPDAQDQYHGKFYLQPLERGYALTIGNALRRVLLSSLPGAAIFQIEIAGVDHEFTPVKGVIEDVTTIILNLKSVVVKFLSDDIKVKDLEIDVTGPKKVFAEDIICDSDVEIVNPNQYICNVTDGHFRIAMKATRGRGYVSADVRRQTENVQPGTIIIDSLFSPVVNVSYDVHKIMHNGDASFEELIMDVTTNGGVKPEDAIASSARILIDQLTSVLDLSEKAKNEQTTIEKTPEPQKTKHDKTIEDLDLAVRSYNCLKRAGINTIGELTEKTEEDMMKLRNLGKKSLKDIKEKLAELGLSFATH